MSPGFDPSVRPSPAQGPHGHGSRPAARAQERRRGTRSSDAAGRPRNAGTGRLAWAARFSAAALLACAALGPARADDRPPLPPGGRYFEDSAYSVFDVTDRIWAIGEPTYYGNNFSYLIVGDERALLLDGGGSREDEMADVVASLADKPLAVIPSHLHYDHTGGIETFDEV